MSQETRQTSKASPSEARQAVTDILRKEANQVAAASRPRRRPRDYRPIVMIVLSALSVVLWLTDIPFLRSPGSTLTPAERVANERFTLYLQAQRIERYRIVNGRLPATLEEAGEPIPGARYELLAGGRYRVHLATPDGELSFGSGDSVDHFMGGGMKLLGLSGGGS